MAANDNDVQEQVLDELSAALLDRLKSLDIDDKARAYIIDTVDIRDCMETSGKTDSDLLAWVKEKTIEMTQCNPDLNRYLVTLRFQDNTTKDVEVGVVSENGK